MMTFRTGRGTGERLEEGRGREKECNCIVISKKYLKHETLKTVFSLTELHLAKEKTKLIYFVSAVRVQFPAFGFKHPRV